MTPPIIRPSLRRLALPLVIGVLLAGLSPQPAALQAAGTTIVVTTTADELNADGDCALREAIVAANRDQPVDRCPAGRGPDTITLSAGVYQLQGESGEDRAESGDLDLTADVTIAGVSAAGTIIEGSGDRIFEVLGPITVRIRHVTIRNGLAAFPPRTEEHSWGGGLANYSGTVTISDSRITGNSTGGNYYQSNRGGGIYNTGTLTLERSAVSDNEAHGSHSVNRNATGGGIYNTGTLTLIDSVVSGNQAEFGSESEQGGEGGGIYSSGTLTVERSTISDNIVGSGFEYGTGGGIAADGTVTIRNSTISGNRAEGNLYGGGRGGGLAIGGRATISGSTITGNIAFSGFVGWPPIEPSIGGGLAGEARLEHTIIAGNLAQGGIGPDCAGTFVSGGFNLLGDGAGCTLSGNPSGNQIGVDPRLGPLADNGGPTPTHALLPGSPAIDAGSPAASDAQPGRCLPVDQRGVTRPLDGDGDGTARCDIGAVEQRAPSPRIAVTTTADELNADGDCALREAIVAANRDQPVDACSAGRGADWIIVPPGTYTLARAGRREDAAATGDLDLTADVTISGAGAAATIIDGGDLDRVFEVLAPAGVYLSGLTIRNGSADEEDNGSGIRNWSMLTLHHSIVAGNISTVEPIEVSDRRGGGIYNTGRLLVRGSTIRDNVVPVYDGDSAGGGIYNTGQLLLVGSTISGNAAPRGSGSADGGGIYNTGLLIAHGSTISDNRALSGVGIYNAGVAEIRGSTITGNRSTTSRFYDSGGGILNTNLLTVDASTISDNSAYFGGGLGNWSGYATVTNTTISGNLGGGGDHCCMAGGVANFANLQITNSTISGNTAVDGTGGIVNGGQLGFGTLTLNNVTIARNRSVSRGMTLRSQERSFGLVNIAGQGLATLSNTILAENTAAEQPSDCAGELRSLGTNLIQNAQGCTLIPADAGDLTGVDPRLGPLADNGGPTPTHALLPGSPAIDAGNPEQPEEPPRCEPTDQRGVTRPRDGNGDGTARCDIGAFELGGVPPSARITSVVAACDFDEYQPGDQLRATITIEIRDGSVHLDALVAELEGATSGHVTFAPDLAGRTLAPGSYTSAVTFRGYTPIAGATLRVIVTGRFAGQLQTVTSAPISCEDDDSALDHHVMLPMITK